MLLCILLLYTVQSTYAGDFQYQISRSAGRLSETSFPICLLYLLNTSVHTHTHTHSSPPCGWLLQQQLPLSSPPRTGRSYQKIFENTQLKRVRTRNIDITYDQWVGWFSNQSWVICAEIYIKILHTLFYFYFLFLIFPVIFFNLNIWLTYVWQKNHF